VTARFHHSAPQVLGLGQKPITVRRLSCESTYRNMARRDEP
jgi:hypothetical protein